MRDPGQPGRFGDNAGTLQIDFVKRAGWIGTTLAESFEPPILDVHQKIEDRARLTELLGPQPLWDGYSNVERYPRATEGTRRPDQVRIRPLWGRFMSWLAATRNPEFVVEFGTAFGVSGMYWLAGLQMGRLELYMRERGLVLFDDIDFSADMEACWHISTTVWASSNCKRRRRASMSGCAEERTRRRGQRRFTVFTQHREHALVQRFDHARAVVHHDGVAETRRHDAEREGRRGGRMDHAQFRR
jgi:hypothetical protein